MSATMSPSSSPRRWRRPRTPPRRSTSTMRCCLPIADTAKAQAKGAPAGPRRRRRTTRSSNGISATRRRPTRPSRPPSTSPSSTSSTTAWCPTPWSRAPPSATTMRGTETYTLYTTSQNPHVARLVLSAFVGIAPEHKLRVIAPDVGGGFGSKIFIYAEETVCVWAAKQLGRPVKWTGDRTEAFLADAHGRDHITHAELAVDDEQQDHRPARPYHRQSRRLSVDLLLVGADLSLCAAAVGPVRHSGDLCRGRRGLHQHRAGRCLSRRRAARRRPMSSSAWSRWRRARLGIDPAEFRRKNFIRKLPAPDAGHHDL